MSDLGDWIREQRALEAKAVPGPWAWRDFDGFALVGDHGGHTLVLCAGDYVLRVPFYKTGTLADVGGAGGDPNAQPDLRLIVTSRNTHGAMLSVVEAAERALVGVAEMDDVLAERLNALLNSLCALEEIVMRKEE